MTPDLFNLDVLLVEPSSTQTRIIRERAAGLLARAMGQPAFPTTAVSREGRALEVMLGQQEQDPGQIASRAFYAALYGAHPYAGWPEGTVASVRALDRRAVAEFHQRHYVASNAVVVIVGALVPATPLLVLTGGLVPGANFRRLFKGSADSGLTILSIKDDTYVAAVRIAELTGELAADDMEKLELVENLVARHADIQRIYRQLGEVVTDTVTPRMFLYRMMQKARADRRRIALPEGTEPRIVRAAAEALDRELCDVTLLGDKDKILEIARAAGVDIGGAQIIDPKQNDPKLLEGYAEALYELRKHKNLTREMARDLMLDPVHYATMMVQQGDAGGFVSGSTHSTADTLGPVLRVIKTREGVGLASSIFFMCLPDHVLVYGDCALVENPTAEQMADIAITSAETARAFGIEPRVALLSYSTGQSGKGKDVDKVREAARLARERRPDLPIEGPIQYDAAVSEEVARIKLKDSRVAGRATVYIFPDLDAGNTAYKAVQRSANVPAIGPIMQGLRKPANDLSRDEEVVFFPTSSSFDKAAPSVTFFVHGWCYEPEANSIRRQALLDELVDALLLNVFAEPVHYGSDAVGANGAEGDHRVGELRDAQRNSHAEPSG